MPDNKKITTKLKEKIKTRRKKRTKLWNHVELVRELKLIASVLESKRSQGASIEIKTT